MKIDDQSTNKAFLNNLILNDEFYRVITLQLADSFTNIKLIGNDMNEYSDIVKNYIKLNYYG